MQKLLIEGKKTLSGSINISGSKNSTLPILAATIFNNYTKIKNIPLVNDIFTMLDLLKFIGLKYKLSKKKHSVEVINDEKNINTVAPYKLVKTMRAGVLVLGPLLAKYKKAKVSLPGGCAIGTRPVDLHLFALKKLGAKINIKNGYILATAINGLKGTRFKFPTISVGATENAILAAAQAKGTTIIDNCAIEPEIIDLIKFLKKLGVKINIEGRKIKIKKPIKRKKISYRVICDRIELGTYLIGGALIAKKLRLNNINPNLIKKEISVLKKMRVKMSVGKNYIEVFKSRNIKNINITTAPYPGFPTDLQAQIMILMTQAKGLSKIKESIFENRFMHVPELKRMGAKIEISNNVANISGPSTLTGAEVMATDLRASVSLVLAALIADNRTKINRIYHLDRGYQDLEKKLIKCKAKIKRV
jgi:UDP-N-acetylglucosamine 1-carboxyvinyltransferase